MSNKGSWHMSPDGVARRCSADLCPFGDVIHGNNAADVYRQDEMSKAEIRIPLPVTKKAIPSRDTGVEDLAYQPSGEELRSRLVTAHGYTKDPDQMQFAEFKNHYRGNFSGGNTHTETESVSFAINNPDYNYATVDKLTVTKKYIQFKGYKEEFSASKVQDNQKLYGELTQKIRADDARAADIAKMSSFRVLLSTGKTKRSLINGIRETNNYRNSRLKEYARYLHPKIVSESTTRTTLYMHNTPDHQKEAFDFNSNKRIKYKTPPIKTYDVDIETNENWRKSGKNYDLIRDVLKNNK